MTKIHSPHYSSAEPATGLSHLLEEPGNKNYDEHPPEYQKHSLVSEEAPIFAVRTALRACRHGLGARQSFGQKSDLAGVVRFVFANVEPFPIDIYLVAAVELLGIGG